MIILHYILLSVKMTKWCVAINTPAVLSLALPHRFEITLLLDVHFHNAAFLYVVVSCVCLTEIKDAGFGLVYVMFLMLHDFCLSIPVL